MIGAEGRGQGGKMVRLIYTRAEWQAVAHELTAGHRPPAPPGVVERINALLRGVPDGWPDEPCALELDSAAADVVRSVALPSVLRDRNDVQPNAVVAAAEAVIRHCRETAPEYEACEQIWIGKDANALELQSRANRFLGELGRRGGAVLQTHFVAVPVPPSGVEYTLCLIYRDTTTASTPAGSSDAPDRAPD